jgi:hypothetical protein
MHAVHTLRPEICSISRPTPLAPTWPPERPWASPSSRRKSLAVPRTRSGPLTGLQAASGIGKDTGFSFAEADASRAVFADRDEEDAREAAGASKQHAMNTDHIATTIHVDVTDEDTVQKMVDYTLEEHGRIDYFVHSAGVSPLVPVIK